MADISKLKLPNGTIYDLKDSYVRTNYRALSNNDFDTINVTELNAGDLIVTGAARFLNTINGSISGNAATATKATQDESGNNIKASYASSISISDHTITLKNKNGVSLGTVTVPDNATDNTKMPLSGGTFTGRVAYNNVVMPLSAGKITSLAAGTTEIFKNGIAISNPATSNDVGWIRVIGTGESDTVMEIATGDDGGGTTAETIVIRQYNTSNAIAHEAKLLDPSGNTSFPGTVTATKFIGALQGNADTATKLGSSNVGSATNPIYLSGGTATACTYTLGKSVPSDAVFTDTKYTAGTGLTLSDKQFSVSSANASTIMNLLSTGSSAPTDNDYYIAQYAGGGTTTTSYHRRPHSALWSYIKAKADTTYVNVTGDTMSGNLAVTNVLGIAQTAGNVGGISLYGGTGQVDTYGIAFRLTSNKEKHGYVQGDWATYFTMNSGATTRGWVFRTNTTNGNVASISGGGNAVFNGSVTVGGNTTNTSGVRQVYNSTTKSLDFVFVA